MYTKILKFFFIIASNIILARWLGKKYSIDYKSSIRLTDFQFQAIIGLMLGDLCAERTKFIQNTRLRFEK